MSELTDRIRSRAHWLVEVRPAEFVADRVPDTLALEDIAMQSAVRSRGWVYPFIDRHEAPRRFEDRIICEMEFDHHLERWEFHRSGYFIVMHGHPPDWRDSSGFWPLRPGEEPPLGYVGITWVIGLLTDFYTFASRLAQTPAGDEAMRVDITFAGIANRVLRGDAPNRAPLWDGYRFSGPQLTDRRIVVRDHLIGATRGISLEIAQRFFAAFGWRAEPRILKDIQEELYR